MRIYTVDPNKCTGCHLCEMACSFKHHNVFAADLSNIRIESIEDIALNLPVKCMQCEEAGCIRACVAGALSKDSETGAIQIDRNKCIGCKACIMTCPFGSISLVKKHRKLEISVCDLCSGDPECVKVCRGNAIAYIDESKLNKEKRNNSLRKMAGTFENS